MLIGHDKTVSDLKRLADEGNLSHGYIFFGPSGVGKRTVALGLAGYLENGVFEEAKLLNDGLLIKPDEKRTIGIDEVREIKNFLWQKPNISSRRTLIIDQAELMTTEAQNALLKIAEEPPPSTLLILITQDSEGLAYTITSRLQKIYFGTVKEPVIAEWLADSAGIDKKEAAAAAKRAFGKPGLAYALVADRDFGELLKSAEKLLTMPAGSRRDLIKKMMAADNFNLEVLLDAMIVVVAEESLANPKSASFWHKMMKLRGEAQYFNLNPRLQLENLFY